MGKEPYYGGTWNNKKVYNYDLEGPRTKKRIADDLGFFEKRTVEEAKEIIKRFSGGKHFLKNKNLKDSDITTRASSYIAMKKLDNVKKLDNLDVTEEMIRKPNAKGGIQTMLGE